VLVELFELLVASKIAMEDMETTFPFLRPFAFLPSGKVFCGLAVGRKDCDAV
jgi:hypothetical protein